MNPINTTHELKTWPFYYQDIANGNKKFEIRLNDRDFKIGDMLILKEYDPDTKKYTNNFCTKTITYILYGGSMGLKTGYVILSIA